jgi:hypothetical protein
MLHTPAAICGSRYEEPDHGAAAPIIRTPAMKIAKVKEHIDAIVTGHDLAHPVDSALAL